MFELNVHVLKFNVQISNVQVREFDLQNIYKQHQTAQLLHATITYLHRQESQIIWLGKVQNNVLFLQCRVNYCWRCGQYSWLAHGISYCLKNILRGGGGGGMLTDNDFHGFCALRVYEGLQPVGRSCNVIIWGFRWCSHKKWWGRVLENRGRNVGC